MHLDAYKCVDRVYISFCETAVYNLSFCSLQDLDQQIQEAGRRSVIPQHVADALHEAIHGMADIARSAIQNGGFFSVMSTSLYFYIKSHTMIVMQFGEQVDR